MMQTTQSEAWFQRAKEKMPGGGNSPVRAFPSVGGAPRFICKAKGNHLYDLDGNEYLDYIGSWGPMILGHNPDFVLQAVQEQMQYGLSYGTATALEVEMAELISEIVPCVEMIRMVNSGTEAVMSAVRVARGFTGRDKIIKFAGCYHGHADAMLVKAGSGVMTAGIPDSSGVPSGCTKDTLTAVYNDAESVKTLFEQYPNEVACVIVEPVAANMGVVPPKEGFLQQLRTLCNQYGALLIFDEVITGFRLQLDGACLSDYNRTGADYKYFFNILNLRHYLLSSIIFINLSNKYPESCGPGHASGWNCTVKIFFPIYFSPSFVLSFTFSNAGTATFWSKVSVSTI